MTPIARIPTSITGQSWHWRGNPDDCESGSLRPDSLVDTLLLSRGVARDDLERHRTPSLRHFMPDPALFRDMTAAAQRIARAIIAGEKITVFGDYDVDGATSAALLIRLFRMLGHDADYYIPDRLTEGYGPSGDALVALAARGSDLVITVDCGAQAFEALELAHSAGLDVIVVDHHKCASALPVAHALVNPNRLDEADEAAAHGHLAAVGVAFLLAAELVRTLRAEAWFKDKAEPNLLALLDLVALGTVADVAQLRGLNRAFVSQGLKVLGKRANIGLSALGDVARLTRAPVSRDLGFAYGPRINAGGRVGKSDLGVRLLTTNDPLEAAQIAAELDVLNNERRAIEATIQAEAEQLAELQRNRAVCLVSAKGWHPGVIGIVAGRVKEKSRRPSIVIAIDEHGVGKGSGRSISGVDLGAAVLAAKDEGLLVAGGGHAMAAGLTVDEDRIEALAEFLDERLRNDVDKARAHSILKIDALLSPGGVQPHMIEAMEAAGPYGAGWPSPCIALEPVRLIKCDVVGTDHVRIIAAGPDGKSLKGVAFRQANMPLGQSLLGAGKDRKIWLAGRAVINEWNGNRTAELHIDDAAWAD